MKVDGTRPEQSSASQTGSAAQAAQAAERLQQQQRLEQQRAGDARADRVELSDDARLADNAVRAASNAPEIRQDVVDRVRAKLDSGELGKDLYRLADRMIDNLLSR